MLRLSGAGEMLILSSFITFHSVAVLHMEFCCGHTQGLHPQRLPQLLIWCCDCFMYTKRTLPNFDILSFFSQSLLLFLFLLLPYAQNMMHKIKKQTNNNLHTQPAALFVHTSWSYIVFTVVPSRVQLFVKERLYPGLLEVFGFLLHCKRLPLWAGRRHTCRELCTHNHKTTPCSFVKCCTVQFALAGAEAWIHFTSYVRKSVRGFSKHTFLPKALFTFEVPWRLSSGATCGLCSSRKSMKALGGFLMYVRSSLSCCLWFSSLQHRSRWRAQASTG